jgi:hypothetical protein
MANTTLYTAVTGIVVSGVAGPAFAAWASRRGSRQQFDRQVTLGRRDDLRSVLDQAAELLSTGATNIRIATDAARASGAEPEVVREWASQVHLLQQRLRLRLPATHGVVRAYDEVRNALIHLGAEGDADGADPVREFEAARSRFLDEARRALEAPVTEAQTT